MLKLNIQYFFSLRGIKNPYAYMKKLGFSHDIAHRLANNQVASINLMHMSKLCTALYCTPNDLIEYHEAQSPLGKDHPLTSLKRDASSLESMEKLRTLSPEKIKKLQELMAGME